MIEFVDVYKARNAVDVLFDLLKERDPAANISHQKMPTFEEHSNFFASKPYFAWYLLKVNGEYAGSVYLSKNREIGVFIFKQYQGKGYGKAAVVKLMNIVGGSFLANVAPGNDKSKRLFESLGGKAIQVTYKLG